MKIVEGIPLSLDAIIEGVYRKYDPRLEKGKYIIGIREQNPNVLLLDPIAILVKYGGFTSHLAIVCREIGIPLYKVESLDELEDDQRIVVIPKIDKDIHDSYSVEVRFIGREIDTVKKSLDDLVRALDSRFRLKAKYNIYRIEGNTIYARLIVYNVKDFIMRIVENPKKYVEILEEDMKNGDYSYVVVANFLSEIVFKFLISKYGLNRVKDAIPPYKSVWSSVGDSYFRLRFGIEDNSLINIIRYLSSITRKEYKPLDGKDQDILMFAFLAMIFYESKNLR